MEAGNGRARGTEQRSGERTEAGTGAVATWRRREGGPVDQRTTPDRHRPQCHVAARTGEGKRGWPVGHSHSARWQLWLTGGPKQYSAERRGFKPDSKIFQTDLNLLKFWPTQKVPSHAPKIRNKIWLERA
jgi:hypothetical protein